MSNIFICAENVLNEVSSTHLRKFVREGIPLKYLTPDPVIDYISYLGSTKKPLWKKNEECTNVPKEEELKYLCETLQGLQIEAQKSGKKKGLEEMISIISELNLNISKRILHFLTLFTKKQGDISKQIQKGIIPVGFSDDHLWPSMKNISNKLTEMSNQNNEELQNIDKTIHDASEELEELEIRKAHLQKIIQDNTTLKEELQQQKQKIDDFMSLIDNKDEFFETMIQQEANIVHKAEKAFKKMEDDTNLQVIFNCYGLSSSIIQSFKNVSFDQFLNDDPLALCEEKDIQKAEDKLDFCYVHYMLSNDKLPKQEHIKNCPVCICESSQNLFNLLQERDDCDFDELDLNFLETYCMNGPRIISISFEKLQSIFASLPKNKKRQFARAHALLKRLHLRAFD